MSKRSTFLSLILLLIFAFVISFSLYYFFGPSSANIEFGILVGGSSNEVIKGQTIDSEDNIIIVGWTESNDYPTKSATNDVCRNSIEIKKSIGCLYTQNYYGNKDGFISKFSSEGDLIWSTYFGGKKEDIIQAVEVDSENSIIIIGDTRSHKDDDNFTITEGPHIDTSYERGFS
ncbi:MAG: hypothetical protein ACXAD7_26130, partial [Candidatus Kariarchaeaceae archaeon]